MPRITGNQIDLELLQILNNNDVSVKQVHQESVLGGVNEGEKVQRDTAIFASESEVKNHNPYQLSNALDILMQNLCLNWTNIVHIG